MSPPRVTREQYDAALASKAALDAAIDDLQDKADVLQSVIDRYQMQRLAEKESYAKSNARRSSCGQELVGDGCRE
jgi:hypothetical protein